MTNTEKHQEIIDGLHDVYIRKNADYGNSATDTFARFGMVAYVVRLYDKMNRITSLTKSQGQGRLVPDESIEDTLLDMANYCIMAVMDLKDERAAK